MISNKTKCNIWGVISVMSFASAVGVAIDLANGSAPWWRLTCAAIVFAVCFKCYLAYRSQVKAGNLFGKIDPMRKNKG